MSQFRILDALTSRGSAVLYGVPAGLREWSDTEKYLGAGVNYNRILERVSRINIHRLG